MRRRTFLRSAGVACAGLARLGSPGIAAATNQDRPKPRLRPEGDTYFTTGSDIDTDAVISELADEPFTPTPP